MSLSYLNDRLNLDEHYLSAYVVSRMAYDGILEYGSIFQIRDNKPMMTVGYRKKNNDK